MRSYRPLLAMMATVGLAAGLTISALEPASSDTGSVIRTLDWESSADRAMPTKGWDFIKHTSTDRAATITTSSPRDGSYAVRFDLRKGDPLNHNGTRAELSQPDSQPADAERWYGFSINLDPGWSYDRSAEILSQWHDCDDKRCGGGSPPLALMTDEGHWKIDLQGNIIDLGPYATDAWTDWVFHVKWRRDSTGVVEAWRNGAHVLTPQRGSNYAGPRSPYFKFGIYKWDWGQKKPSDTTQRAMRYDALRIGNETASRTDVDPSSGGSSGSPCTTKPTISAATASTEEPANPASNAIDGNLATRWSGQGFGAALVLDLGGAQEVCGAEVAWHRGNQRWNDYTVYTSNDQATWTKAWEGRSTGSTSDRERQTFTPRQARYVRISFWQNPENDWASITEAGVLTSPGSC